MKDLERISQEAKDFFKNAQLGYFDIWLMAEFHFSRGKMVDTPVVTISSTLTFRFIKPTDAGILVVLSDTEEILPYESMFGYSSIDRPVEKLIRLSDEIYL